MASEEVERDPEPEDRFVLDPFLFGRISGLAERFDELAISTDDVSRTRCLLRSDFRETELLSEDFLFKDRSRVDARSVLLVFPCFEVEDNEP